MCEVVRLQLDAVTNACGELPSKAKLGGWLRSSSTTLGPAGAECCRYWLLLLGVLVGAVEFLVVLLVASSKSTVDTILRQKVKLTFDVLGLLSLPAMIVLLLAEDIAEEMLFRAVIEGWLAQHIHYSAAIGIAATLLGLLHSGTAATFAFTSLYGVLFGVAYHLTESFILLRCGMYPMTLPLCCLLSMYPGNARYVGLVRCNPAV